VTALRAIALRALGDDPTDPTAIYVAGSSAERQRVREDVDALAAAGYRITCDWTRHEAWDCGDDSDETLVRAAAADLAAVWAASVVWYQAGEGKSEGSAAELGAALALGKEVVVSGPWGALGRVFPRLATVRYFHHAEARAYLIARLQPIRAGIAVGDAFLVNGVALEVVEAHDGHYWLKSLADAASRHDIVCTDRQLAACERAERP
jgi:hypothetical protein